MAAEEAAQIEAEREAHEHDAAAAPAEPPRATFADLGLSEPVLKALEEAGYQHPTPIQEKAIPFVLMGRDVLGVAQTGTGKTAAFTLPMLDILQGTRAKARMPRSLILEPTRELALQVAENFVKYGKHLKLVHALLIGGESMDEQRAVLEKGVDVLIATPGRLLDLFDRGRILLADVKVLVIDEADRMLDMGFIPDVERIVSLLPKIRQTLFFSATMAPEIRRLADAFLSNPKEIEVARPATVASTIVTGVALVREREKREALRRLIRQQDVQNALIFCNRKVDVDILHRSLKRHGFSVGALHGDMDQSQRFATLNAFKAGEIRLLVCSDVAARGLDIGGLSHVFNFDVPFHAEDYVHRIGRTGRAGREGHAYTIATPEDAKRLAAIEKLTGQPIPRLAIEGLEPVSEEEMAEAAAAEGGRRGRGGRRGAAAAPKTGAAEARRGDAREGRAGRRRRGEEEAPRREARRAEGEAATETAGAAERPARAPRPERERERPERAAGERERAERGRRGEPRAAPPARREDRDLGPRVRGFGDAVPAFMTIPIPRPRRGAGADTPEAEAA
ncbi:DEAD/DEAH box helicase [Caldovatus sediminis]|nr:DEAD/DEAH box helicase [Caldovatus sediminis]